ncbi:leucine-rich repeat domain-containing protein [Leyella stercorea]|uniref:leucine-rich repeat domain-containing protein n=1 Tax=Leyella stercorea TaxID=363265 RepID=UPI0024308A41|nr:leucine-rich repeat domain-containing protein [Leyella stercorea]
MKRVYFTLTLMSLFGGLNAFATVTKDGVVYDKMSDGKCFVVGYDEATMPTDGIVTIVNTINIDGTDYTVTGILGGADYTDYNNNGKTGDDRAAFFNCKKIIGLRFADGSDVTLIGDHAFKSCTNLKTIENIPSKLTEIKKWCFEETGLESIDLSNTNVTIMQDGVFFNNKSLTSIQLPNKLENFWDNAFKGCTALKNIAMPSTVVGIYNSVFEDCTSLSNVTLKEGCTTLGHHVFKGCPFTSFTFPSTLNSIGEYAFENTNLKTVDLSNTQIKNLPNGSFLNCPQLSDVKLPIGFTYIGNHAFKSSPIASITFPPTLEKIDTWAFQYAHFKNVVIPTSCSAIGEGAFSENDNLTTVFINGVKCYLAVNAFANCGNLKDVYITSNDEPNAERYGYPFKNNSADLTVHVVPNYLDTFTKLVTCNAPKFDSNLSLTLGKEWTTLTSAYNLDFSNVEGGLIAYTAKYNKDNDAVALTPVKKVKAHTGLILKGEAGKTYTVPILASNEEGLDEATDNQLVDCVDAVWSTGRDNDYFLSNGKFVKSKNHGWALPGKSYLYINGGRANKSESPLRVYVDNTATAINGITTNPVVKDEAYYNLQGVKVQRPQHGVFIHNGKKVVLK